MKHSKLRWEANGLWPGDHNSVIGDCGYFATSDRAAKWVHIKPAPLARFQASEPRLRLLGAP